MKRWLGKCEMEMVPLFKSPPVSIHLLQSRDLESANYFCSERRGNDSVPCAYRQVDGVLENINYVACGPPQAQGLFESTMLFLGTLG